MKDIGGGIVEMRMTGEGLTQDEEERGLWTLRM